ncbi:hypothetical protein KUTeg_002360 [Tegillarca granosa]|uniref:Uncharacterized protein n=1 Tax=Tegillarca granosa TaxID=220873 RepID=A0ABQ9FYJ7_TEGGR|nr:hypothetical protein KUTeg_002360 [Tegillarca granosa]
MSVVLQLLIAVEKGDVHTYKGMSLSDISVADKDELLEKEHKLPKKTEDYQKKPGSNRHFGPFCAPFEPLPSLNEHFFV